MRVAQKLTALWRQTVVVDNRPGGTGVIALETAARAQPDGYTIVMISGTHSVQRVLYRGKLVYDLVKDFAPVTQMTRQSYVLVLHPGVAAKSISDLVALAKSKPGTDLRLRRAGQPAASVRRAVRELHRNQPHAYPVQGRRTGAHRRAGGPDRHGIRDPA